MWKPGSDRPKQETHNASSSKEPSATSKNDSMPVHRATKTPAKFVLSQKTLAMKFMQRKKKTEAQRIEAVQEQHIQDTWVAVTNDDGQSPDDGSRIICTRDVPDPSLPLLFGRRSFNAFNKGVEDELKEAARALRFKASEETELREEISAEEMTARMLKYTGLGRRCGKDNSGGRRPSSSSKRQRK
uniref:M-phase phosphoprotein 6 n=1 Tax=Peronospora matthiolae TaxID=2874970 RepID=A0AAV1UCV1_9STRA